MSRNTSLSQYVAQLTNMNNNLVELFTKFDSIANTNKNYVSLNLTNENGDIVSTTQVTSLGFLGKEIDRLNNNINQLYNINASGAVISPAQNKWKKIITVDVNQEPPTVGQLNTVTSFESKKNWFFDSVVNPMMTVKIDLSGKVNDSVREVLVRRYIVPFERQEDGTLTDLGQEARNSFNSNWRGRTNISLEEFETWYSGTAGVVQGEYIYDQQIFPLDPISLRYKGTFSPIEIQTDSANNKIWYVLDSIDYTDQTDGSTRALKNGDFLTLNRKETATRYKVVEIDTDNSTPRVRFEIVEGVETIPVIQNALKIWSPMEGNKSISVSIGYDEYNVVFLKPITHHNGVMAREWSLGVGYYTSELIHTSNDNRNGLVLSNFYKNYVEDYGLVIKDLVKQNIPVQKSATPSAPTLSRDNFKIVVANNHLFNSNSQKEMRKKNKEQKRLKSQLTEINRSISAKQANVLTSNFTTNVEKVKFDNEIKNMANKRNQLVSNINSINSEIINLGQVSEKQKPKYRLRGFWPLVAPVTMSGTRNQEIVTYEVEYRYLSISNAETPLETFRLDNQNATFSPWVADKNRIVRKRKYDASSDKWIWLDEELSSADSNNINQLDIPISPGEKVLLRVRSVSEVGYPQNPLKSDWSEILEYEFTESEVQVGLDTEEIQSQAKINSVKLEIESDLENRGVNRLLDNRVTDGDNEYWLNSEKILSGFSDSNSNKLSLYDYLLSLQSEITSLKEQLSQVSGKLSVSIFKNNEEFVISSSSQQEFNLQLEDYMTKWEGTGQGSRVYNNQVYAIKDFQIVIKNSNSSPLSLLADSLWNDSQFYNSSAPQTFWVNDRDELLYSNLSTTQTQLNYQWVYQQNFVSIDENDNVVKLASNIGNDFSANGNYITDVLSSTQYNVGYNETTLLQFEGSNNDITEITKWSDETPDAESNWKMLTTCHPVIPQITDLVANNDDKKKVINSGSDIKIPISIFFKPNSINPNIGSGLYYEYLDLSKTNTNSKHVKKLKFWLKNAAENQPFTFTLTFNLNRNKIS